MVTYFREIAPPDVYQVCYGASQFSLRATAYYTEVDRKSTPRPNCGLGAWASGRNTLVRHLVARRGDSTNEPCTHTGPGTRCLEKLGRGWIRRRLSRVNFEPTAAVCAMTHYTRNPRLRESRELIPLRDNGRQALITIQTCYHVASFGSCSRGLMALLLDAMRHETTVSDSQYSTIAMGYSIPDASSEATRPSKAWLGWIVLHRIAAPCYRYFGYDLIGCLSTSSKEQSKLLQPCRKKLCVGPRP